MKYWGKFKWFDIDHTGLGTRNIVSNLERYSTVFFLKLIQIVSYHDIRNVSQSSRYYNHRYG